MDIHPIFVHFPIALLSMYCLFEMLRFRILLQSRIWFYLKASFLILGTGFSVITAQTGEFAGELGNQDRSLVGAHEFWAKITIFIFVALAGLYSITWGKQEGVRFVTFVIGRSRLLRRLWNIAVSVEKSIVGAHLLFVLALFGLAALFITGALGGAIVYGKDADLFTRVITDLFLNR